MSGKTVRVEIDATSAVATAAARRKARQGNEATLRAAPDPRAARRPRAARVNPAYLIVGTSVLAVAALIGMLAWPDKSTNPAGGPGGPTLVMYCAAGLKPPVDEIARDYQKEVGTTVQIQFEGSGSLLGKLQIYKTGDLLLVADQSYIDIARSRNLLAEVIPIARQTPVIAVKKGNPKNIKTLPDLLRNDVKVSIANPEGASIGKVVRERMEAAGQWNELNAQVRRTGVFKPTVSDCANDVKLGTADASILWDATVKLYPELEAALSPAFENSAEIASIAVLKSARDPTAALRFARYVAGSNRGLKVFQRLGFDIEEGDEWQAIPQLILYSGAMLRPGIEKTLKEFEQREGVRITTVYNGCGILTSQMRAGDRPDAYFSCDTSFMDTVADMYLSPLTICDNDIMIIVPRGNPRGIKTVDDLARQGVRVGVAHPEKSAMGALTQRMLMAMGQDKAIKPQMVSATGDLLVNSLRTGALDAIIACRSNAKSAAGHLEAIPIAHPMSRAAQPYAVGKSTKHPRLMTRLLDAFTSTTSKERFESAGFGWRVEK